MNTVKINVAAINDTNWLLEAAHDVSNATDKDFSELKEKNGTLACGKLLHSQKIIRFAPPME